MVKLFNLLILLSIVSFFRTEISLKQNRIQLEMPSPRNKGPVYNPLRPKPYSKISFNV